jgi:hypothetical protein
MKTRKTAKAGKSARKTASAPKKALQQVDLGVVRDKITRLVGNHAIKMVNTTINEVGKGHYLAMKYMFEMIGLFPATAPEEAVQDDSLAKTLLRRMGLPEETNEDANQETNVSTEVTTDRIIEPVAQDSDAVK